MISRQARFQANRLASGWSRPSLMLSPEATQTLNTISTEKGCSRTQVVEAALLSFEKCDELWISGSSNDPERFPSFTRQIKTKEPK